jgi:hypothetical protein
VAPIDTPPGLFPVVGVVGEAADGSAQDAAASVKSTCSGRWSEW